MSESIREELDRLLKAWGEAIVRNDAEEIGSFATEDWCIVAPEATQAETSRAAFLESVASGALTHDSFEAEVRHVHAHGDLAVATAHVRNSGAYQGSPFSFDEWSTDVFVRRDGRWLCVLTTLIPRTGAA